MRWSHSSLKHLSQKSSSDSIAVATVPFPDYSDRQKEKRWEISIKTTNSSSFIKKWLFSTAQRRSHIIRYKGALQVILTMAVGLLLVVRCSELPKPEGIAPTDLVVNITNPNDGSGILYLQVSAEEATGYHFYFGERENEEPQLSEDGIASYTYPDSGLYTIEVRALGTGDSYSSFSKDIFVARQMKPNVWFPGKGYYSPLIHDGWDLVWQDEFAGSDLDDSKWNYNIGGHGWGNAELQYYQEENTTVQGGYLVIEAKKENTNGNPYTSSRITTQNKYVFRYGRVDIRAALPHGQGLWPALWMLGASFADVGWPACGEVDIMEMIGGGEGRDDVTHSALHWDRDGHTSVSGGKQLDEGTFHDSFHIFSIIWNAESIVWLLDDIPFYEQELTPADMSEFHGYFFFIMNVAVGGNWPGYPDETTTFPQRMIVDYIRVFKPTQ